MYRRMCDVRRAAERPGDPSRFRSLFRCLGSRSAAPADCALYYETARLPPCAGTLTLRALNVKQPGVPLRASVFTAASCVKLKLAEELDPTA